MSSKRRRWDLTEEQLWKLLGVPRNVSMVAIEYDWTTDTVQMYVEDPLSPHVAREGEVTMAEAFPTQELTERVRKDEEAAR